MNFVAKKEQNGQRESQQNIEKDQKQGNVGKPVYAWVFDCTEANGAAD